MKHWKVVLGGTLAVVLGLILSWRHLDPRISEGQVDQRNVDAESVPGGDEDSGNGPTESALEGDASSATVGIGTQVFDSMERQHGRSRLSGRVLDLGGNPVEGAEVSWTPVESLAMNGPALGRADELVSEGERMALTDREGLFVLPDPSLGVGGTAAVLWISCPGYLAQHRELEAETNLADLAPFALEPRGPLEILVIDGAGNPVDLAEVVTVLHDRPSKAADTSLAPRARAAFRRSRRTGPDGTCILPAAPGEQLVVARLGRRAAAPWQGLAPAGACLVLRDTFSASGSLRGIEHGLAFGAMEITVSARSAGQLKELGRVAVTDSGSWGPVELSALDADAMIVRLDGGGAIPQEERRDPVPPGGSLVVHFEVVPGLPVTVLVRDELQRPVPRAVIEGWWRVADEWVAAKARTDAEGIGVLDAVRPGDIWLRAHAAGYVRQTSPAIPISAVDTGPFLLELPRAGRIAGRVLALGEPVSTFRVAYWDQATMQPATLSVNDGVDGRFELDEAPLGQVGLFASAPLLAPSEPTILDVVPGESVEVEIELVAASSGRGRVVDGLTGLPIEGARVATWIRQGTTWIMATGIEARADARGEFVLEGLSSAQNHLRLSAEGYAPAGGVLPPGSADGIDLGIWPLAPAQDLLVRLRANGFDPRSASVRVANWDAPALSFDAAGEAWVRGLVAGAWTVLVDLPDGAQLQERIYLASGQPWSVELESDAGGSLEVRVLSEAPLPPGLHVHATSGPGVDLARTRVVPIHDGRCRIPGPLGSTLAVELKDFAGAPLAIEFLDAARIRSGSMDLRLEGTRRALLVVDRHGDPLPHVLVVVEPQVGGSGWIAWRRTDADGRAELVVPPHLALRAHLQSPGAGACADLDLPDVDPGHETELVLDVRGELFVRYSDRGHPLQGVLSYLIAPSGFRLITMEISDAEGRSRSGLLGPGDYQLDAMSAGIWPRMLPITVHGSSTELTVELRRLGSLELLVTDARGLPLAGAALELESVEFEESVAVWISQGRVQAPLGGLRSGPDGALRVTALPNGPYRYALTTTDGRGIQGQLEVSPHAAVRFALVVPD